MTRHCRECGNTMQLRHDTFARAGGYTCINRNCPNCPHFRYRNPRGKLMFGAAKAEILKRVLTE